MMRSMLCRFLMACCLLLASWCSVAAAEDKLAAEFAAPPDEARPHTWWHWMNGNISKEGITADLEAMKRAGLRGATMFNVDQNCPPGPVTFLGDSWWDMTLFAAQEANRLGLTLGTANCGGWSSSGGPWVTPENAMKMVVTSEVTVKGGGAVSVTLPQPLTQYNLYKDIAVVAFPALSAEKVKLSEAKPKITASVPDFKSEALFDGDTKTQAVLPTPTKEVPQYIQFEFAQPFVLRSVSFLPMNDMHACKGEIQISTDGVDYITIGSFEVSRYLQPWMPGALAWHRYGVEESTAKFIRIVFIKAAESGAKITLAELDLSSRLMLNDFAGKTFFERTDPLRPMWKGVPADQVIDPKKEIDLSSKMDATGKITWDAPAGEWTILRVGYTTIARNNHPAPKGGAGLEIDKLSRAAAKAHWDAFIGKMAQKLGPLWGKTVNEVLIDSYEVGSQNWTPGFGEEFAKRRGYDLLTYLPVFTGRVVAGADQTDRFLWDFRLTVADLMAENYYDYFSEMAKQSGVKLASEPYGNGPFDEFRSGREAGIVMGEFWVPEMHAVNGNLRLVSSIAHTYGKNLAGAEALTSRSKWADHPRVLKPCADVAMANGINYFEMHSFVHQPWMNRLPGLSLGPYGSHLTRTNTWWEQGGGWLDYLGRCQYLLRQGLFVGDVLYFYGEGTALNTPKRSVNCAMPEGYNFDWCGTDVVLNRLTVKDGKLTLPDGMSYRVLVLPPSKTMTPALLRKLKELVAAGAVVVGSKPEQSPSLSGYPGNDAEVKQLAEELWGSGKIREPKSLGALLGGVNVPPDLVVADKLAKVAWIHRAEVDQEIYFLSNDKEEWLQTDVTFRVAGKVPEFWYPDSGKIVKAAVYEEVNGRTRVPVRFDPYGSIFVVFREPAKSAVHPIALSRTEGVSNPASVFPDGRLNVTGDKLELEAWSAGHYNVALMGGKSFSVEVSAVPSPVEISGSWELSFPAKSGAPGKVTLDHLISWSEHSDPGVKYFSGTATYRKTFDIPAAMLGAGKKLYLDLGRVEVMAGVTLNRNNLGVLWKKPYCIEITDAAKAGSNVLEIAATNLWPNRLIGDEQLPDDSGREKEWMKQWPQWIVDNLPSPSGRLTFASWRFYKKDDPLLPSGVIGPVTVRSSVVEAVK